MARPALCHLFFLGKLKKLKWYKIKIRFIGLEVLVGFRVTRLLGHVPSAVARVMSGTRIGRYTYWAVAGGPAASSTHNG